MGELLDRLNAAEAFDDSHVEDAHRPFVDQPVEDPFSVRETVQTRESKFSPQATPFNIIMEWTRQAPLQAYGAAFLFGVILARR